MVKRTGSADLPLHGGRVPPWLASRMASLGRVIVEAIVHHYDRDELLRIAGHRTSPICCWLPALEHARSHHSRC